MVPSDDTAYYTSGIDPIKIIINLQNAITNAKTTTKDYPQNKNKKAKKLRRRK